MQKWWAHGGRRIALLESERLGLGIAIGAVVAAGLHLATRDPLVAPIFHRRWSALASEIRADGVSAYEPELLLLSAAVAAIMIPRALRWIVRYARAWWAGISGAGTLFAAFGTAWAVYCWTTSSVTSKATVLPLVILLVITEFWRQNRSPRTPAGSPMSAVSITESRPVDAPQWLARNSDDPIADWGDDVIGRASVVELLADYILNQRAPVVALHGALGDGKSSVLNLLRTAIEGRAIVVSFTAWLPGSEATLAAELFKDIAIECRKFIYVPQLRKRALAFARLMSDSVPHLGGLKGMIPQQSQKEEVEELQSALSRIPLPIAVLLDEVDRMQKDELQVLLKVLRGACSIQNVTFVCAFSDDAVKRELGKDDNFLEKYFPVSVKLSPPGPEVIARCLQQQLRRWADEQGWCRSEQDKTRFAKGLDEGWEDALQPVVTNFRKAGRLLNGLIATGGPIAGEVNPFDLVLIETLRLFHPSIYEMVRTGGQYLTAANDSRTGTDTEGGRFLVTLRKVVDDAQQTDAVGHILGLLFPAYARVGGDRLATIRFANSRNAGEERRIQDPDYFQIYFRSAVPEEMFSSAEVDRLLAKLNASKNEPEATNAFSAVLDSITAGHAKRHDFLFKLARSVKRLDDVPAEYIAYATASRASSYQYDLFTMGETGRAVNLILAVAQRLADSPAVQRVLETAMIRSSDDILAVKLLAFTEDRDRNRTLTNYSHVEIASLKAAFVSSMRRRYSAEPLELSQSDFQALRRWVDDSEAELIFEQTCLRRYAGTNRRRLAEVINVVYPGGMVWSSDPTPIINSLFPLDEIKRLLTDLPIAEALGDVEASAIARILNLFNGDYPRP
jgi:KAP family P-loop domain